jgi:hypothetical protein
METNEFCTWVESEGVLGEVWESGCGETGIDVQPDDNNFNYCPFCGKPIELEERWGED